jgi:hypothetical protein
MTVLAARNAAPGPQPRPPARAPGTGVSCFRQGGDPAYCRCLDRMESARAGSGQAAPGLPPLDQPAILYAMRHPRQYPIVNWDTLRCVTPPVPTAPAPSGTRA